MVQLEWNLNHCFINVFLSLADLQFIQSGYFPPGLQFRRLEDLERDAGSWIERGRVRRGFERHSDETTRKKGTLLES